jgi:hypothetical protein
MSFCFKWKFIVGVILGRFLQISLHCTDPKLKHKMEEQTETLDIIAFSLIRAYE